MSRLALALLAMSAGLASGGTARADGLDPLQFDFAAGGRLGSDSLASDVRLYVGGAVPLVSLSSSRDLFLGGGLHAATGAVSVDEDGPGEQSLAARRWRTRVAAGPEVRLGYAAGRGRPDVIVYGAAAVGVAWPNREGPATGAGEMAEMRATSTRAAIGIAWPGSFEYFKKNHSDCQGGLCSPLVFLILAPNSIEISYEHSRVADGPRDRFGLALGYTF